MQSTAMEQSRYLMWTRRKPVGKPHLPAFTGAASYGYSWEEQAFAEDSAGRFGGCVWPPRSYSCSFCRREFKSAQALGGHMNVHRRDRARLKMSPTAHVEGGHLLPQQQHHQHPLDPCLPLVSASQHPSPQVCAVMHQRSPNPKATHGFAASPSSPPGVSLPTNPIRNSIEQPPSLIYPSYASSMAKEERKGCLFSTPLRYRDDLPPRLLASSELNLLGAGSMHPKEMESREDGDIDREDGQEATNRKRRRTDASTPFALRTSLISDGDESALHSEVLSLSPSHTEELDLELRLGDRPKITHT